MSHSILFGDSKRSFNLHRNLYYAEIDFAQINSRITSISPSDFLDKLGSLRRILAESSATSAPLPTTLVHCSAGVGRTGVVLLVEAALARLERVAAPTPTPLVRDILESLRAQRMYTVQTVGQYRFCLNSVARMTQSSRLI